MHHCCRRLRRMRIHEEYLYRCLHLVWHFQRISIVWEIRTEIILIELNNFFEINHTCRSNSGGLSLTSVISTVNEHTPSRLGSPWSVALTVTETNLPSSPSRSNTLFVDTSPVSSSTVNFVPFWLGCCTIEYFT